MKKPIIPWQLFWDCFNGQTESSLRAWLDRIKFTDQGEVRVRLLRTDDAKWGIEVEDTGRGIPANEVQYIFDTFRQVEGATTRVHGGFGLGLAIVKQLVTLMSGDINVESKVEAGTKFIITLPLVIP